MIESPQALAASPYNMGFSGFAELVDRLRELGTMMAVVGGLAGICMGLYVCLG